MAQNKILIVDADPKEAQRFETMLGGIIEHGGELLFAQTTEEGLAILQKENPQLVFLDTQLVGGQQDLWVSGESHIVLMRHRDEPLQQGEDFLLKPLKEAQVLKKCREALDLRAYAPPIPPM